MSGCGAQDPYHQKCVNLIINGLVPEAWGVKIWAFGGRGSALSASRSSRLAGLRSPDLAGKRRSRQTSAKGALMLRRLFLI